MDLRGLPSLIMSQVLKKYPLVIRDIRKYLSEEGKQEKQGPDTDDISKSRRGHKSDGESELSELEVTGHGGPVSSSPSRPRILSQYDDPIPLDHYINANK